MNTPEMKSSKLGSLMTPQTFQAGAVVVLLLAAWFGWQGWECNAGARLAAKTEGARAELGRALGDQIKQAYDQLESKRQRPALLAAVKAHDLNASKDLITSGWPEVEDVLILAPDLALAYADPKSFGYSKLAVFEGALAANHTYVAIVKDAGGKRLALAAPVLEDGEALAVIYARLPVASLVTPITGATPSGAYIALRQGGYTVAESGNLGLAGNAELGAVELPSSGLRVVGAAPRVLAGMFNLGGWGEFGVAALLAMAGAGLLFWSKRVQSRQGIGMSGAVADGKATLAELQQAGQIPAPEKPAAPAIKPKPEAASEPAKLALDRSIFRAYDIRGVVGQTLDVTVAKLIGQAIGSVMQERNCRSIVVGRDGRLSSPQMSDALIEGLRMAGRDVFDIGEAATPVVYFGTFHLRTGCGVAITGSHNPADYNGFKIVVDGETLAGEAIQNLYARIAESRLLKAETLGQRSLRDINEDYLQRIAGDIQIERKLKVVIDCGSGVAGAIAPKLLEAIGAEVEPLYCEVDGTFPHHHPDPSDPANLQDLVRVVQRIGADLGLALDGDGDRLGVVTRDGEMIYPDRLLMLFAADVLERNPGACVIYDVKCTGYLAAHILRHGGSPLMWKTGHSLIKAKMKETEAELAGEMSGHFFFRERWYGFDDGMYAAARLLEILATRPESPEQVFATLPKGVSTPELKIPVTEGEQFRFIEKFTAAAKFEGARVATIDGVRADWADGWGLVRASNTTPMLILRFDAKDGDTLSRVQAAFREQLLAVDPNLALPF